MVKVKICGLSSIEDAEMVCDAGVDFVGTIVQVKTPTPREIDPRRARKILNTTPEDVLSVVVTTTRSLKKIRDLEKKIEPDYLQLHFELSELKLRKIVKKIKGKVIGVVKIPEKPVNMEMTISRAKRVGGEVDLLLLDTEGVGGGTGRTHNWEISSKIRESLETPSILAGGLTPGNVEEAIEKVNPFAVDVASGVESEPGEKDPKLVGEFLRRTGR